MSATTTLAELAVSHPGAARVFYRHRLDFCCNGRRTLADACAAAGVDANGILGEIAAEGPSGDDTTRWVDAEFTEIIDHIVGFYHARLRQVLPTLVAMAERVEERHGDKPECPRGLKALLEEMHEAVQSHLAKEEQILFPMILNGLGRRAAGPVHVMELEHDDHGANLQRVRALTTDLEAPEVACTTWRALYLGLQQLEQELMEHIHVENNILFRRALAS